MNLNLGCGWKKIPGFVNVDINEQWKPDMVGDIGNIDWLTKDNSVSTIVAYDVIEHFDRTQYPLVLKNWFCKLKDKGVLMIRTNDLDRLVRLYASKKFLGIETPMAFDLFVWHLMCEHEIPGMGHKWGFNRETIEAALKDAGFRAVKFYSEEDLSRALYPYSDRPDLTNLVVCAWKGNDK